MDQIDFLRYTIEVLERLEISYALVGSFGSSIFGEPRFTRDIDILIDLPETKVSPFCSAFPPSEFYLSETAVRESVRFRRQFNLLHPGSGNKADFILPRNTPWSGSQLSRSIRIQLLPNLEGSVASPVDVIIGKLWYYSEGGGDRHLRDIAGILRVSGALVDRSEVERWCDDLGYLDIWRQVTATVEDHDDISESPDP
jgi:predicted nucleotidyltransferase